MCLFTKIFKRWHFFLSFVTVLIGNRTLHHPILCVAILETDKFPCCSDPTLLITWLYDYEPNWTPLSCINIYLHNFFLLLVKKIQDGDYARMNSLTTELVEKLFDDVNTSHEAFLRGVRISGQKFLFQQVSMCINHPHCNFRSISNFSLCYQCIEK